jgi:hypothetical protein
MAKLGARPEAIQRALGDTVAVDARGDQIVFRGAVAAEVAD